MKSKVVLAIVALVLGAIAASVLAWVITGPSKITLNGYVALGLTLVIGGGLTGGLMALLFYSANHGYDDIDRKT